MQVTLTTIRFKVQVSTIAKTPHKNDLHGRCPRRKPLLLEQCAVGKEEMEDYGMALSKPHLNPMSKLLTCTHISVFMHFILLSRVSLVTDPKTDLGTYMKQI